MTPEVETSSCPLCGAAVDPRAGTCRDCGSRRVVDEAAHSWTQPRFEAAGSLAPPRGAACIVAGVEALGRAGETAVAVAFRPQPSFLSFRFEGPLRPALAFVVLLLSPCLLLHTVLKAVLLERETERSAVALLGRPWVVVAVLLAPIVYVVLRAHLLHLALVVAGRARRSFCATFRVVAYSCGSLAPALLFPFVGDFLFVAASVVVEGLGLRAAHGLTTLEGAGVELLLALPFVVGFIMAVPLAFLWLLEMLT